MSSLLAIPLRQLVITCQEHDAVPVAFEQLLNSQGKLEVYDDVARNGYFDIDFRQGSLIVKATRFVGYIPISDRVVIHVLPKAPIANLLYMVARGSAQTKGLSRFIRGYAEHLSQSEHELEDIYARSFLTALSGLKQQGLLRRYILKESDRELRGRLLLTRSVARQYARGRKTNPTFEFAEHTADIEENQVIKATAARLKRYFLLRGGGPNTDIALRLNELLHLMEAVSPAPYGETDLVRRIPRLIRGLPAGYSFYEPALWLSYLIAVGRSVRMDVLGPARFESLIMDVSSVFEAYIRSVLLSFRDSVLPGIEVIDGNVTPIPLFVTGVAHTTRPDFYFRRDGEFVALADAKYKADPSTQDRYEVLAFCDALGVQKAAIITPEVVAGPRVVHHGTTRAGRDIWIVRINLAANDLQAEERAFVTALGNALQLRSGE